MKTRIRKNEDLGGYVKFYLTTEELYPYYTLYKDRTSFDPRLGEDYADELELSEEFAKEYEEKRKAFIEVLEKLKDEYYPYLEKIKEKYEKEEASKVYDELILQDPPVTAVTYGYNHVKNQWFVYTARNNKETYCASKEQAMELCEKIRGAR